MIKGFSGPNLNSMIGVLNRSLKHNSPGHSLQAMPVTGHGNHPAQAAVASFGTLAPYEKPLPVTPVPPDAPPSPPVDYIMNDQIGTAFFTGTADDQFNTEVDLDTDD
ncbi:MAG: hypothetical protein OES99_01565, partial [Gammaproteobacteria bacterium]|nr:hypothetical protein [Gammaproteobacteria bacterium]